MSSIGKCDITLIYPPWGDPCGPHPAVETLSEYLTAVGFRVDAIDANVDSFSEMMAATPLADAHRTVRNRLRRSRLGSYSQRAAAMAALVAVGPAVAGAIGQARRDMRSARTSIREHQEASQIAQMAMRLLACAASPWAKWSLICFGPHDRRMRPVDVVAAASGELATPFDGYFLRSLLPRLQDAEPMMLGISVTYLSQLIPALRIGHLVRSAGLPCKVCLGGAAVSRLLAPLASTGQTLNQVADFLFVGDAEVPLARLLQGEAPATIPNLVPLAGGLQSPRSTWFHEPKGRLLPTYSHIDDSYWAVNTPLAFPVTRGCSWGHCVFCSYGSTQESLQRYRACEPAAAAEHILGVLKAHQRNSFYLSVDMVPVDFLVEFAHHLPDDGSIVWHSECRLDPGFRRRTCQRLVRHGLKSISFGLESGSVRVLGCLKKGIGLPIASKTIKECGDAGISVGVSCIAGFPGETEDDADRTVDFLLEHAHSISDVGLSDFALLRDSPMASAPGNYGLRVSSADVAGSVSVSLDYETITAGDKEEQGRRYLRALDAVSRHWPKGIFLSDTQRIARTLAGANRGYRDPGPGRPTRKVLPDYVLVGGSTAEPCRATDGAPGSSVSSREEFLWCIATQADRVSVLPSDSSTVALCQHLNAGRSVPDAVQRCIGDGLSRSKLLMTAWTLEEGP